MTKQRKTRKTNHKEPRKDARRTAVQQSVKKRTKTQHSITKNQAEDLSSRINSEFAEIQAIQAQTTAKVVHPPAPMPQGSMHDLAAIMKGL